MSLIKKPSELSTKNTISCLIYGAPGVGKSSLGCSAPNAVLFDYDGGVQRINGAHRIPTVQIESWEQTQLALKEIDEEMPECQTIIIDTVGKMLDYMSAYIIKNDSKMGQRDGSLALKGYGVRKTMFVNFIKQLAISGRNVIFIAHEREDKRGDDTVFRPEIGGSSANDLIKELDLVGYVKMVGRDRTITFDPTDLYYAKNACNLPSSIKIPVTVDENGNPVGNNNFFASIINAYVTNQEQQKEKTIAYESLIKDITEGVELINDVDELNSFTKSVATMEHIFDSKVKAGQLLNAKAKKLNAKFDAKAKAYVAA